MSKAPTLQGSLSFNNNHHGVIKKSEMFVYYLLRSWSNLVLTEKGDRTSRCETGELLLAEVVSWSQSDKDLKGPLGFHSHNFMTGLTRRDKSNEPNNHLENVLSYVMAKRCKRCPLAVQILKYFKLPFRASANWQRGGGDTQRGSLNILSAGAGWRKRSKSVCARVCVNLHNFQVH